MDASNLPKGQSNEQPGDGRPINEPGVYRHTQSGAELITSPGADGTAQADALMNPRWQGAWVRVSDVPSREEILAMQKAQVEKEAEEAKPKAEEPKAAPKAK